MSCFGTISIQKPGQGDNKVRISVPCGKCAGCLSNLRNDWTFRLKKELKNSMSGHFITMTYDDENITYGVNNKQTLVKRDVQLFLKRLRKFVSIEWNSVTQVEKVKISLDNTPRVRYYIVGEYGTKTNRPHYHGLFFNLQGDAILNLKRLWAKGFVYVGQITDASIHYTTSYIINKSYQQEGVDSPFSIMSRKPGIGYNYLKDAEKWHKENKNFFVVNEGGFKQRLPRYYKEKIFISLEKEINNIKSQLDYDNKEKKFQKKMFKVGVDPFEQIEKRKNGFTRKFYKQSDKNEKL